MFSNKTCWSSIWDNLSLKGEKRLNWFRLACSGCVNRNQRWESCIQCLIEETIKPRCKMCSKVIYSCYCSIFFYYLLVYSPIHFTQRVHNFLYQIPSRPMNTCFPTYLILIIYRKTMVDIFIAWFIVSYYEWSSF